jgi:glycosyltransferase domain-containing protein
MSGDSDLTILLTLKDRASFTNRWMSYANTMAFPFKILIADGGRDENVQSMLSDKIRYPNVDFEYIRYPYDRTYSDYYTKIADGLRRVRTPFVAMADNDDFFIVDALREAIQFLSVNPDYVSCGGQGAIFWIEEPSLVKADSRLYGKNIHWKCTQIPSITGDTARERIRNQTFSSVDPSYYNVIKIEHARKNFEIVQELNLSDLFLTEELLYFLTIITGKTKRLKRLYLARQHNSPESSGAAHQEKSGDWFGRMLAGSWSVDFAKFVDALSGWLATTDGISIDEAKEFIIASYRVLVAPSLLANILDEPSVSMSMSIVASIVRRLVRLPEQSSYRRLMRSVYRSVRWVSPDVAYGENVFWTSVPGSTRDFQPISEFLAHRR